MLYSKPNLTRGGCIEVLHFLTGLAYDQNALNYIHAVRPSRIAVMKPGMGKVLNSIRWRVWVYVDENNFIKKIEQEVELGDD